MRAIVLRAACVAALLATPMMAAIPAAGASEGGPLAISQFSIELTERTEERLLGESNGRQLFEMVNVPYAQPFTQAGGHPWGLTTVGEFATETAPNGAVTPTRELKDIVVNLPPGLLGDPMAVPSCPLGLVTSATSRQCPGDTQIGVYRLLYLGGKQIMAPIVNVTPEAGQSAEFALENTTKLLTPVLTAHLVRTSEGYGFAVVSKEIPLVSLVRFEATFWGVPVDPSHDPMRGRFCLSPSLSEPLACFGGGEQAGITPVPFVSMPTNCPAGSETAAMRADSWEEPGSVGLGGEYRGYVEAQSGFPTATSGVTGCNLLQFNPGTGIELKPDTELADAPVALGVDLKVPLVDTPGANATPQLQRTVVTLPQGLSVSPGVIAGIKACNAFGPEGINITGPESESVGTDGELHLAPGHCPDASIVGTAEAITPFLPEPVKGHVFLARPGCGGPGQHPCTTQDVLDGNLYKLYLELGGEGSLANTGIEFKVPLETEANPATGQLTSVARELLQAPYSEVKIRLNGGPRAPIDNPPACGAATATADFTPWSAPGSTPEGLLMAGTADLTSSSFFNVLGCASPVPFSPGFVAGTVRPDAGQFSAFTLNISRQDREQYVKGIRVHTPPGLLAMLASVPLCAEPQADQGSCPQASKIGTTRVASGAGSHPFELEGEIYLTGPHDGAPFGLSIVVHLVAGPFNLGIKVVRARIDVGRSDSTATITADETGPFAIPQIVFGVPVRLRRVTVDIDRPNFMLNPTNCGAQQIAASIAGHEEAVANVASPFAVGNCRSLSFKPTFRAFTNGSTSRAKGASLDVTLSYPANALNNDTNIARVKVSLPRQLPSRLTTLQKACSAEIFNNNPAACPQASIIGIAHALTPLLPAMTPRPCASRRPCRKEPAISVAGPVYFVSHGGQAFPNLVVVLEGDGVRVDLVGDTFIDKAGITSSTFNHVPDVPVNMFELYLPQGKYSALAANGDLCSMQGRLQMPTEFVAQNGAIVKQRTQIAVGGCKKPRSHAKKGRGR